MSRNKNKLPPEVKYPHRFETQLREAIEKSSSIGDAAKRLGIAYNTCKIWMRKFRLLPEGNNPKGIFKKIKEGLTGASAALSGSVAEAVTESTGSRSHWASFFGDGYAPVAPVSTLGSGGGLRREYSSVQYLKERNAAISASMESGGSGCVSIQFADLPTTPLLRPPFHSWR